MAAWFKPKRYGYGATPVTFNLIMFAKAVVFLIVAVWIVSKRNTDGEWRWRWGKDRK